MTDNTTRFPLEDRSKELTARDLIAPLFRHRRLLIISFVSVVVLVILFALVKGPSYASHMAILMNRERMDPLVSTEATTQMMTAPQPLQPEEVNSEVELLDSRDVLEKVVLANDLEDSRSFSLHDFLLGKRSKEDRVASAVKALDKKLKTEVTTKTNVITVTYSSPDPSAFIQCS